MKKQTAIILSLLVAASCSPAAIYVSPEGSDTADGSRRTPLATINAALDKAVGFSSSHKGRSLEIILAEGDYPLNEAITIDGSKLTGPLTIRAAKGATPSLLGLRKIDNWTKVTDPYALERIPDPTHILQADLQANGITDFGFASGDKNRLDFYCEGKRMHPAQWPNTGLATAGKTLGTSIIKEYSFGNDIRYKEPLLEYLDERIDSWADEKDPYMHGYWGFDWYDMYNPVVIDKKNRSFTINGDTSGYGFISGCHFRGINLLCELDEPGEFWLDRETGHLFWYAPDNADIENGTAVSVFSGDYAFVLNNCKDLIIKNINICGCRGGAICITGGDNITIEGCDIHGIANDAVVSTGSQGLRLCACTLSELGNAGLIFSGGDRNTLTPSGLEVTDCIIENLSLYRKTYRPCIRFGGCGALISHNCFRNCPSSALRLDGNDIKVEYNVFDNLVRESDDQGGIDIYDNYTYRGIEISHNYFHNVGDPAFHWAAGVRFDDRISGMRVLSNIFDHCGSSSFGCVQIHGGHDNHIEGNVFFAGTMALSLSPWPVGPWKEASKRECEILGLTPGLDSLTDIGKLYLERYPELKNVLDTTLVNVNYLRNNLIVNTDRVSNNENYTVFENNTVLEGKEDLEYWISDKTLARYGIAPIDFKAIGPCN